MSLQWTFIATFLYTELGLCALLMLPFISASRWQKIFKSKFLGFLRSYANLYFNIFIVVLVILFIDALRDMSKYMGMHSGRDSMMTEQGRLNIDMKMFRAQRNYYIAGFSVFLWFVLRRLVTAISKTATLEANVESLRKQAESANNVAKQLMEDKDNKSNEKEEGAAKKAVDAVNEKEFTKVKEELAKANRDLEAMKKQAESTNREYDRLMAEHAKLQDTCKALQGAGDDKKDD